MYSYPLVSLPKKLTCFPLTFQALKSIQALRYHPLTQQLTARQAPCQRLAPPRSTFIARRKKVRTVERSPGNRC